MQALLVALETPRSPRGLHLLARHSQALAAALLHFLQTPTNPSLPATTSATPSQLSKPPFTMASDRGPGLSQQAFEPLQAVPPGSAGGATDGAAALSPTAGVAQQQRATAPLGHCSSGRMAAAVATAHRGLESMLAREGIFTLPSHQVAQAMFSPAVVLNVMPASPNAFPSSSRAAFSGSLSAHWHAAEPVGEGKMGWWTGGGPEGAATGKGGASWGLTEGAGVYVGCCSLVMAGLRHHAAAVRRCMALIGASTRALLRALMHWAQSTQRSALLQNKNFIFMPVVYSPS